MVPTAASREPSARDKIASFISSADASCATAREALAVVLAASSVVEEETFSKESMICKHHKRLVEKRDETCNLVCSTKLLAVRPTGGKLLHSERFIG